MIPPISSTTAKAVKKIRMLNGTRFPNKPNTAKAASMNGKYVYVLPNNIMYKRSTDQSAGEMLRNNGFISLQFSGNIAVIRTRPGYASSMAYDIDNNEFSEILGTIAGDDTIMLVLREGVATSKIRQLLSLIIPNIE